MEAVWPAGQKGDSLVLSEQGHQAWSRAAQEKAGLEAHVSGCSQNVGVLL